jgi:hypothetical protein
MYLQKVISKKTLKKIILVAILKVIDEIAGSGAGFGSESLSQRYGSANLDPDPYQFMSRIRNTG